MPWLLSPPFALVVYVGVACLVLGVGRVLGGRRRVSSVAETLYASGEAPTPSRATPGYQPFFGSALFFALLHVAVLIASIVGFEPLAIVYVAGVLVVLLVVAFA
jgi:NADH:ubiquinone oxidoreductase subunit 3 (subunit A)